MPNDPIVEVEIGGQRIAVPASQAAQLIRDWEALQRQKQPQPRGWLDRLARWFMNTRLGKRLASSPTPIAPGGPVARELPRMTTQTSAPAKPVTDPIAEAQQLVKQGVPAREASKRLAERVQAGSEWRQTLSNFWNYLSNPRSIIDENASDPGLFFRILNLLNAPLHAGAASDIADLPDERRPDRFKGRDWASLYAEAPTWGTTLEAYAPRLPVWLRSPLGFALDILTARLYGGAVGRALGALGQGAKSIPALDRALTAAQWQVMKALHPTAAKVAEQTLDDLYKSSQQGASAAEKLDVVRESLKRADELQRQNDNLVSNAWHSVIVLDPRVVGSEQLQQAERLAQDAVTRVWNEALARQLAQALKLRDWKERAEAVRQVAQMAADVGAHGTSSHGLRDIIINLTQEVAGQTPEHLAAVAEALRRVRRVEPSAYERTMSHIKRAVTALNIPAGAVRNFAGNFIAQWLAGQPVNWRSIVAGRPLRELIDEAFSATTLTRRQDIGEFSRWADWAARFYSGADKLAAAVLARVTGKRPAEFLIDESFALPEPIDKLQRWGIIPFASWPTWIAPRLWQGMRTKPERWMFASRLLTSTDEQGEHKVNPATLVMPVIRNVGVSVEPILPLSPYLFASEQGEAPEILRDWMLPALWRDVMKALAGQGATPKALTWAPSPEKLTEMGDEELRRVARVGPYIDALTTLAARLSPPAALTLMRLITPQLFADHPRYKLPQSAYWLRLLGVPVRAVDPVPREAWESRDLAAQLRMRAQVAGRRGINRQ